VLSAGRERWDVTVRLKDGTCIVAERYEGHGDTYGWKDREAVFEKFKSLAGAVLAHSQLDSVINAVMELEKSKDVSELADVLTPTTKARRLARS
jgi:hypothetical protein